MPIVTPGSSSTSSASQTLPTVQVYDYLYYAGGTTSTVSPLVNAEVRVTLQYDRANATNPVVNVSPTTVVVKTDSNGFWSVYLVPNDVITPSNTLYTVQTPYETYSISVASTPGSQQSSAIVANAPGTLSPAATGLTGPITVTGNLSVSGNTSTTGSTTASGGLTVTGGVTMTDAASTVVPGGTSFSVRNHANTNDNLLVSDAGAATVRNGLTVTAGGATVTAGGLTVTAGTISLPAASVADAALSSNVPLKNAANTFSAQQTVSSGGVAVTGNSTITGTLGLTNALSIPPTASGTVAPTSYGSVPVKIDQVTLGSAVATLYDSNTNYPSGLPAGFRQIEIVYTAALGATGGAMGMRFNNDSAGNYDFQVFEGTASGTATSTNSAAQTYIRVGFVNSTATPCSGRILIPLYGGTTFQKTSICTAHREDGNGSTFADVYTGQWRNTAAVTRIQIIQAAGTFATGSTLDIYGIP